MPTVKGPHGRLRRSRLALLRDALVTAGVVTGGWNIYRGHPPWRGAVLPILAAALWTYIHDGLAPKTRLAYTRSLDLVAEAVQAPPQGVWALDVSNTGAGMAFLDQVIYHARSALVPPVRSGARRSVYFCPW